MTVAMDAVVDRIIGVESDGDPNAKNKRSSATGLAQFLSETWLDICMGAAARTPNRSRSGIIVSAAGCYQTSSTASRYFISAICMWI
jgi:hypothetical protein